ncbi:MAG: calcium/sodium antiporter [Rickettsiales bacterium]|nr:calcium/sodium antiporter [Rickettsiales bacterium]
MINFVMIIFGFSFLFLGGEMLIRGGVEISKRLGISAILIGMVVVGFGTSMPELLVSIKASSMGESDIVLGNIVGSNIANTLLVLGMAAIIMTVECKDKAIYRDSFAVMVVSISLMTLSHFHFISRFTGLLMLFSLLSYLFYSYKAERRDKSSTVLSHFIETTHEQEIDEFNSKQSLKMSILMSVGGMILLVFGADFLVKGASNLARQVGISEAVIGLSLIAVGTSLPELATSIMGSIRKNSDIVIGNILGSNLFNILGILGITSIIKPININSQIANFDIPLNMGISIILLFIIFLFKKVDRTVGAIFLIIYITYIIFLYSNINVN